MMREPRPCIVWGAKGHAKAVFDIIKQEGGWIDHFFDNDSSVASPIATVPISYGMAGLIQFVESLPKRNCEPSQFDFVCAIGGNHGDDRIRLGEELMQMGFAPRNLIHRSAVISSLATIGSSCQFMAGSIVGPFVSMGNFSIANSGSSIDHECIIGEGSHIAPMATLAGEVHLGRNVFVGLNATVLPRVSIGDGAVIGAGAVVTKNVPKGAVMIGSPARDRSKP